MYIYTHTHAQMYILRAVATSALPPAENRQSRPDIYIYIYIYIYTYIYI